MNHIPCININKMSNTRQSVQKDLGLGETDAHVAVSALANYLHLVVVDAAGGRYGTVGSDAGCVLVRFARALVSNS